MAPENNHMIENKEAQTDYISVYLAGGIFTQFDITTNVEIKEAIWHQSQGKYLMTLPQSKELRDLASPNIAAYIRNADLAQVLRNDMIIARLDGLELDAGTLIEFMFAKFLGKPAVILRCDSRRLGSTNLDDPYNLMVKNWPRTIEVHFDSLMNYIREITQVREELDQDTSPQLTINKELDIAKSGIAQIAQSIIEGLESAQKLDSPYPEIYQELAYKIARLCPGEGFANLYTDEDLNNLFTLFKNHETL